MTESATTYFRNLFDLVLKTEVTEKRGRPLTLDEGIDSAVRMIVSVRAAGNKVLVLGNGGSAAIAGHMHNDLCKMVGVRAMAPSDVPLLTALSNDDCYDGAFEHLARLWCDAGDLLIGISSSGRSESIVRPAKLAESRGCQTMTLSGFSPGNPLRQLGELNFYVPSDEYGPVESIHSIITHQMTDRAALVP